MYLIIQKAEDAQGDIKVGVIPAAMACSTYHISDAVPRLTRGDTPVLPIYVGVKTSGLPLPLRLLILVENPQYVS